MEVLAVSASGRSLVLGVGAAEGVDPGDEATLLETEPGSPPLPVAVASAVKVHDTRSYWLVEADPAGAGPPVKGRRYLFESPDRVPDVVEVGGDGAFFGEAPWEGEAGEWTEVAVEEPPPGRGAPAAGARVPPGADPAAVERIEREGPRWSAGLTREEMRERMVAAGVAEERSLREEALRTLQGREFFLLYARGLADKTRADRPGGGGIGSSVSLGHERPLGRSSPWLRAVTVVARAGRGGDFVPLRAANAKSTHSFVGLALNCYPLAPPDSQDGLMPFLGWGVARGWGEMTADDWDAPAVHGLSVSSLHAGVKRRFAGRGAWDWGLSLLWELRAAEYALDRGAVRGGVFDTGAGTRENRIALGWSVYL